MEGSNRHEENGLFRPEAIAAQTQQAYGEVRLFTPWPLKAMTAGSLLVAFVILAFLFLGHYTRQAKTLGKLVPARGLIEVVSQSNGTIRRVHKNQGDTVAEGQPLAMLLLERNGISPGSAELNLTSQLNRQKNILGRSTNARTNSAERERAVAAKGLTILLSQKDQVRLQVDNLRKQLKTQTSLLEKLRELNEQRFVSILQVQQQEAGLVDIENQISSLQLRDLDLDIQISKQREFIDNSRFQQTQALNDLEIQQSNIDQKLDEVRFQRSPIIVAPASGTIVSSTAKIGQAVSPGRALFTIVPKGSELQAELLVPSASIGFITEGKAVKLRYSAFPYQQFGIHKGTVTSISKSALSPAQATAMYGERFVEPIYRVTVSIAKQTMSVNGKEEPLIAGMQVEGDILLERRSLIDWILSPAYGLRRRLGQVPG